MIIDNDLFRSYLICKYKSFLMHSGKKRQFSIYGCYQNQKEIEYRKKAIKEIEKKYEKINVLKKTFINNTDLQSGKLIVLGVTINNKDLNTHVDVLEKVRGKSALGSFSYSPYLFVSNNKIGKHEKILLAFMGYALGIVQKKVVEYGRILYGESAKKRKIDLTKYQQIVASLIEEIRELAKKDKQPRLMLNKHCPICEFQKDCIEEARDKDDLSLLRGMKEKEIKAQNNRGIFTVTQYSYTFRPRKEKRKATNPTKRRYHALQALAKKKQKVFVYGEPYIPTSSVRIYMDIETVPYRDFVYLIGLMIDTDDETLKYSFWADSKADEGLIAEQFLKVVKNYDEFLLFHYGSIEIKYIKYLHRSYIGGYKSVLDILLKKSVNVLSLIYENFYFPVYQNSLKSIAGYLCFRWSEENLSGLSSIMMREQWEKSRNNDLKDKLVTYNLEDCYAPRKIMAYLNKIKAMSLKDFKGQDSKIAFTNDYKFQDNRVFKNNDFIIDDLAAINKCAYFDYQRDKIYVRTNKALKKRLNRIIKKKKTFCRVNKIIKFNSLKKCPHCGSNKINRYSHYDTSVIDLKFIKNGVKRWLVKYDIHVYKCKKCNKVYNFKNEKKKFGGGSGANLISWVIYENIVKGVGFNKIQTSLEDQFRLSVPLSTLFDMKSYAANYYKNTTNQILKQILNSSVIHVDETPVKLKKNDGYVWVFTSMEEVLFIYKSTREGKFLKELFEGYKGVLISDFYGAYESLNCIQQKCLIHLIRDLNDDLHKNPFDDEFREITKYFSILLKDIVETIDRYGLKKRFLKKHNKAVERFYRKVIGKTYRSEMALQYQKRFKKNDGKLFAFLNYDGVPWNNNNVEHVIKYFATVRQRGKGLFSEKGLNDYLILCSIYQTCQYKQLNFLEFLLSKERQIP